MPLDRTDLRNLVEVRLADARLLLDNRRYDGAYYLAGYAVECALKAVIAARTRQHEFPDLVLARRAYTHNLRDLLDVSGLKAKMDQEFANDPELRDNWSVIKDWDQTSRYDTGRLKQEAEGLYAAISDPTHGI